MSNDNRSPCLKTPLGSINYSTICMFLSVIGFALFPVFFALGNAADSPFWFAVVFYFFVVVFCLIFLNPMALYRTWRSAVKCRKQSNDQGNEVVRNRRRACCLALWGLTIVSGIVAGDVVFFALAIRDTRNPVIATMIYETWPVLMVLIIIGLVALRKLVASSFENHPGQMCPLRAIGGTLDSLEKEADGGWINLVLAFVMCFAGATAVLLLHKHDGKLSLLNVGDIGADHQLWGMLWAGLASITFAASIVSNRIVATILTEYFREYGIDPGIVYGKRLGFKEGEDGERHRVTVIAEVLSYGLAKACALILWLVFVYFYPSDDSRTSIFWAEVTSFWAGVTALWHGEITVITFFTSEVTLTERVAFVTALVTSTIAAIPLRLAQHYSPSYGVNLWYYITPVLAVALLLILPIPAKEDQSWDTELQSLLIGLAAIMTGILLVGERADRSTSFKGLIVSLWLFGLWISLYDAPSHDLYFEAAMVTVTMFVLVFSFRRESLVDRMGREEDLLMSLWQTINRRVNPLYLPKAREYLNELYKSESGKELEDNEKQLRKYLMLQDIVRPTLGWRRGYGERVELSAQLGQLIHSKQRSSNLGEMIAVCTLGAVAICSLLLFLPTVEMEPIELSNQLLLPGGVLFGWLTELSAMLISATIVYLLFSVWDLQVDRRFPVLDEKNCRPTFLKRDKRRLIIYFSIFTVAVYTWVLYQYWEACYRNPNPVMQSRSDSGEQGSLQRDVKLDELLWRELDYAAATRCRAIARARGTQSQSRISNPRR